MANQITFGGDPVFRNEFRTRILNNPQAAFSGLVARDTLSGAALFFLPLAIPLPHLPLVHNLLPGWHPIEWLEFFPALKRDALAALNGNYRSIVEYREAHGNAGGGGGPRRNPPRSGTDRLRGTAGYSNRSGGSGTGGSGGGPGMPINPSSPIDFSRIPSGATAPASGGGGTVVAENYPADMPGATYWSDEVGVQAGSSGWTGINESVVDGVAAVDLVHVTPTLGENVLNIVQVLRFDGVREAVKRQLAFGTETAGKNDAAKRLGAPPTNTDVSRFRQCKRIEGKLKSGATATTVELFRGFADSAGVPKTDWDMGDAAGDFTVAQGAVLIADWDLSSDDNEPSSFSYDFGGEGPVCGDGGSAGGGCYFVRVDGNAEVFEVHGVHPLHLELWNQLDARDVP